jgi:mono/diheme cytochrome c family protein
MSVSRLASMCGAALMAAAVCVSAQQTRPAEPAQAPSAAGNAERGQYIVERVAMCGECHSARNSAGDIVPGTKFNGGPMMFRSPFSLDWPNYLPRIKGLPGYTDEQAMRLLTQGAIKRDGTQLRLPMPRFRMNQQDAADVIAYLRSI